MTQFASPTDTMGVPGAGALPPPPNPMAAGGEASTALMPNTESVAPIPKDDQVSARKTAAYLYHQYEESLTQREAVERKWVRVSSIMAGVHYFRISGGHYQRIRKKKNEIRGIVPIMDPAYRLELGRLDANRIGVTATAKIGVNPEAYWTAETAQAVMTHWIDESGMEDTFDEGNQHLLYYGMTGYYRYIDRFQKQVYVKAVPGPELFPIPFNAKTEKESDGIQRIQVVTEQWLEQQDEIYERVHGEPPEKKMALRAKGVSTQFGIGRRGAGIGSTYDIGSIKGTVAITTWMKPSPTYSNGAYFFMLDDEMFRANVTPQALMYGKVPMEIAYYHKRPDCFWGDGFCEKLISPQLEANRQWTSILKSARHNKYIVAFDSDQIDATTIQNADSPLIPTSGASYENKRDPLFSVRAGEVGRDVGVTLEMAQNFADRAVGHESDVIRGQSEGRVEGGPATSLLNANAQAPLQPALNRIFRALKRTYPAVLDAIKEAWPDGKRIEIGGVEGVTREAVMMTADLPTSDLVKLTPSPLMVNGVNEMINLVFRLRTMPSVDGQRPELSSEEFRRSLHAMNMRPPGMQIMDPADQRIRYRIAMMINDTKTPGLRAPVLNKDGEDHAWEQMMENHQRVIELVTATMLDPAFQRYSNEVQFELMKTRKFHMERMNPSQPNVFDNAIDVVDSAAQEEYLYNAELDPETLEGQFSLDGLLIGQDS